MEVVREVYLVNIKTPTGSIPIGAFSSKKKAQEFAKVLLPPHHIEKLLVDAWEVRSSGENTQ